MLHQAHKSTITCWVLKLLVSTAFVVVSSVVARTVDAESPNLVCASVYPCDEEGNLLSDFFKPESDCFEFYLSICSKLKSIKSPPISVKSDGLLLCNSENKQIKNLKKQIRELKLKQLKLKNKNKF